MGSKQSFINQTNLIMKLFKLSKLEIWLAFRLTKLLHCLAVAMLFFYATVATAENKLPKVAGTSLLARHFINDGSNVTFLNAADETIYVAITAGEHLDVNSTSALADGIYLVKMETIGKSVTKKIKGNELIKPFKQ